MTVRFPAMGHSKASDTAGVICIGHSYMVCVLNAAHEAGIPLQGIILKEVKNERHLLGLDRSNLTFDPIEKDFSAETKAMLTTTEGPVFSFIGGIDHVQFGLRRLRQDPSEPPFDFVLAEKADLPLEDGAEIIPYDAVREALRRSFRPRMNMLRTVAKLTKAPIYQFESPPPVRDSWMELLMRRKYRSQEGLTPPGRFLRYKLWRVASQLFREQAEELGARFVEHPPEAVDEEGFMRDEFVRSISHGNLAYGALLFDQLRSLYEAHRALPAPVFPGSAGRR